MKGRSRMERERRRRGGKKMENNLILAVDGNSHPIILYLKNYMHLAQSVVRLT